MLHRLDSGESALCVDYSLQRLEERQMIDGYSKVVLTVIAMAVSGICPLRYGDLNFCHRFGSANLADF
jgi:hypothetical protein